MNFIINNMKRKLIGFGITSLFLIMVVPVYAEITEFSIEKNFYTIDQEIMFIGSTSEGREQINVIVINPNGKENYIVGSVSNLQGVFETIPKAIDNIFTTMGTFEFTAFTDQKDKGIKLILEFDGNRVFQQIKPLLQLNSIQDKVVEVEKTITFTASITDSSITNLVYTLEDAPITATIDQVTGKFVWTPSKSYGSFKDVIYNFDIIVNLGDKEDRENISITVKKAYDEPVTEPKVEPVTEPAKSTVASFVDATKDPQSYVNRYNNEPTYKEWFDENYSQYSSIYEAVGLEEPEFGICGSGTKLIDGVCTIIDQDYLHSIPTPKPWWQFW